MSADPAVIPAAAAAATGNDNSILQKRATTEPEAAAVVEENADGGNAGGGGASADCAESKKAKTDEAKLPKRRVCLVLGYVGTEYAGLQKNPSIKAVEDDLEKAIYEAGGIAACNYGDLHKIHWTRAARTDKGVHAVGQSVGMNIVWQEGLAEKINARLPPAIRVFAVKRVVKSFNAKNHASGRHYEYLTPSAVFTREDRTFLPRDRAPPAPLDASVRITPEQIAEINRMLGKYVGTHNFHNFTCGIKASAKNSKRYIWDFSIAKTVILDGQEYLSIVVKGQSFMMHQIRKMIGLVIYLMRFGLDADEWFPRALSTDKLSIPIAPSVGLLLTQVLYTHYPTRHKDAPDPLTFADVLPAMHEFKEAMIYKEMVEADRKDLIVAKWLETLLNQKESYLRACAVPGEESEGSNYGDD